MMLPEQESKQTNNQYTKLTECSKFHVNVLTS